MARDPLTAPDSIPCKIHLEDPTDSDGRAQGYLEVPCAGTVVIDLASPRPLRLSVGDLPVLDEDLWWRRFERRLRAIITVPITAGVHHLNAFYGPRPVWPSVIDEDCPSRNREIVRQALRERRPDRFELAAAVQPGAAAVACSLRVVPAQCVIGGVTFQQVLGRTVTVAREDPPATTCDLPEIRLRWELGLRSTLEPYHARDVSDAADRAASVQRFLVPVANRSRPLSVARGEDDVDDRIEPECAVVTNLPLIVEPVLGKFPDEATTPPATVTWPIVVELPVHEARGRLAPAREHSDLFWPSENELLAKVPRPILPIGAAGFARLHDYAWRMLLRLRRTVDSRSGLPNDYVGTAHDSFQHQIFVWDSSFTAMCTAWGWRTFPYTATLDCLYSRQMDGGYLHREFDVRDGAALCWEPDFSPNPPISVLAEWKIANLTGDTARLAAVYPIFSAQHNWLRRNRRLGNGTYWTTGLANGLDNSPSLGEGYPDLTAQQAHAAEILGYIAKSIGLAGEAEAWNAEREDIGRSMNAHLWSDDLRFFSTSLLRGKHNPNKVVTGFWPLWTGLVPPERVSDCARHLQDPRSFWRHHPIPSLAVDSPAYRPDGDYWLGSTWAPTNAAAAWGFARVGRYDLARRVVLRHLEVMLAVFQTTGCVWENYCAERSERGSWSMPDYAWTSLGPIALLYEILIGVRPDALHQSIRWTLPETPGWGLERIPLGPATIDLCLLDARRISINNDRTFVLEVEDGGRVRGRRIPAGHWLVKIDDIPIVRDRTMDD
jgi:hypothetical protein